jgi:hypothetical protein
MNVSLAMMNDGDADTGEVAAIPRNIARTRAMLNDLAFTLTEINVR